MREDLAHYGASEPAALIFMAGDTGFAADIAGVGCGFRGCLGLIVGSCLITGCENVAREETDDVFSIRVSRQHDGHRDQSRRSALHTAPLPNLL
jgi:hypothetical protein